MCTIGQRIVILGAWWPRSPRLVSGDVGLQEVQRRTLERWDLAPALANPILAVHDEGFDGFRKPPALGARAPNIGGEVN